MLNVFNTRRPVQVANLGKICTYLPIGIHALYSASASARIHNRYYLLLLIIKLDLIFVATDGAPIYSIIQIYETI